MDAFFVTFNFHNSFEVFIVFASCVCTCKNPLLVMNVVIKSTNGLHNEFSITISRTLILSSFSENIVIIFLITLKHSLEPLFPLPLTLNPFKEKCCKWRSEFFSTFINLCTIVWQVERSKKWKCQLLIFCYSKLQIFRQSLVKTWIFSNLTPALLLALQ